jgi:N-acetyl sugar amidotransferase
LRYCNRCVLPDSRPNLELDRNGTCNACLTAATKRDIDWDARRQAFRDVADHARSRNERYDCVIPVSGGKDSTWQVVRCLEFGLRPLAVTWRPPGRTQLGQQNLDNLISLGVDHIDFSINPEVERTFTLQAIERHGTPGLPMHMAIFSVPLNMAVRFKIPLVVWGENSAFEYGGTERERTGFQLDAKWLNKFGVTHGTRAEDWISGELTREAMSPYFMPTEADASDTLAVFLGYYLPWDAETSRRVAQAHGFRARKEGPRTGHWNYTDIDDEFISVHHHLKWHKFGISRLFDNLSVEIRNERLTRTQAVEIIRERGDQTPHEDIAALCEFLRIDVKRFDALVEPFRNENIWEYGADGVWRIPGFLIQDWTWS